MDRLKTAITVLVMLTFAAVVVAGGYRAVVWLWP